MEFGNCIFAVTFRKQNNLVSKIKFSTKIRISKVNLFYLTVFPDFIHQILFSNELVAQLVEIIQF